MDSHILSVWGIRDLTDASSADSMGPFFESRYSSRLKDVAEATFSAVEGGEKLSLVGVNAGVEYNCNAKRAAPR